MGGGWSAGGSSSRCRVRGLARVCLTARRSNVEGRCCSRGLCLQGELLEEKLVADDVEGGEGHYHLNEILQVAVAGADSTQKVQAPRYGRRWARRGREESPPCPSFGGSILPRRDPP
jgi:hypothetical protein